MRRASKPLPTREELDRVWRSPDWTVRAIARRWRLGEDAIKGMASRWNLGERPKIHSHHYGKKGQRPRPEPTIDDLLDLRAYVLARRIVAGEPVAPGALTSEYAR